MNKLQAGFARLNINPPLGTPINGYYKPRHVEGFLDDLEVVALALQVENTISVMLSADICLIDTATSLKLRKQRPNDRVQAQSFFHCFHSKSIH